MSNPFPVQILAGGALREWLSRLIAAQADLELVTAKAAIMVLPAGGDWRDRVQAAIADTGFPGRASIVLLTRADSSDSMAAIALGLQVLVDPEDPEEDLVEGIRHAARG